MSWEKKERRLVWLLFWLVNGLGEGSYMHYLNFPPGSTGFLDGSLLKNLPASEGAAEDLGSVFGWGRPPEKGRPTCVFLPGDFHGHRNLVGYSPWSYKESDTTK